MRHRNRDQNIFRPDLRPDTLLPSEIVDHDQWLPNTPAEGGYIKAMLSARRLVAKSLFYPTSLPVLSSEGVVRHRGLKLVRKMVWIHFAVVNEVSVV